MKLTFYYIGDCISTVDVDHIWDATEMAQLIENSEPYDKNIILHALDFPLKLKIINNPNNFDFGKNQNIYWIYDDVKDIHHFYKQESILNDQDR